MSYAATTTAIRDYLGDFFTAAGVTVSWDDFGGQQPDLPGPYVGTGSPLDTRWARPSGPHETENRGEGGYGPVTSYTGIVVVQLFSAGALDEQTSQLDVLADQVYDLLHYNTVGPVQFEAANTVRPSKPEGAAYHQLNVIGTYDRLNVGYLVTSARRYLEINP